MRNYKNNYRRNRYKNHSDRNYQKSDNGIKLVNNLQNGSDFLRKPVNRNNHNASKLIEKYSSLAREALSNGDKILSENYFQHAEHFIRVQGEKVDILNKNQAIKDINNSIEQPSQNKLDKDEKNLNSSNSKPTEQTATTES